MDSSYKWFGNQSIDITAYGGISGIKKIIVTDGLVGVFTIVLLYTHNFFKHRIYAIGVLSLIQLLLLYQNAYPFWFCMICMNILGATNLKYNKR